MRMMRALALLAALLQTGNTRAEEKPPPTAEEIVVRLMAADDARSAKLLDYTSIRRYSLENKRFGVRAAMQVRVTYRFPGKKRFEILEESGPGAIRTKVFRRMLDSELQSSAANRISPANYKFELIGSRTLGGRECLVLKLLPKTNHALLIRGEIYIDAQDWAVAKIEGAPAQNPSFWLRKTAIAHRYGKFGAFWLPVSNDSGSDVRMFGHTQVRIDYSEYHINGAPEAVADAAN